MLHSTTTQCARPPTLAFARRSIFVTTEENGGCRSSSGSVPRKSFGKDAGVAARRMSPSPITFVSRIETDPDCTPRQDLGEIFPIPRA